jgi:hypothetical protein
MEGFIPASIRRHIELLVNKRDVEEIKEQSIELNNKQSDQVFNPDLINAQKVVLLPNGLFEDIIPDVRCTCTHTSNNHLDGNGLCLVASPEICLCLGLLDERTTSASKEKLLKKTKKAVEKDPMVNNYIATLAKL